ncbi:hypothetical protein B0O99DRAFT_588125 [Bisporella sp. PMI_857]|nr:hypothetical protein B0O99DRAFT_588125 [Bisporella sp. PMI_857]
MASNGSAASKSQEFILRPARLWEYRAIGGIAAETYYDTTLTEFLSPHREAHPRHYRRGFRHRALIRMLDPRNLTIVACQASDPSLPIGYTQLQRIGNDAGAQAQIRSRKSIWLSFLNVLFALWRWILVWVGGGNKSESPENLKLFLASIEGDEKKYWDVEGRRERWYVQSCVVRKEFQGLGIGKRLMGEVIKKAEKEGVVVGLEASEEGEKMYRRVGFRLLGRFDQGNLVENNEEVGGIMIWEGNGKKVV